MNTLIRTPISTPAEHLGQVDATQDRTRPCARSLEQAFGPYARNCVISPMEFEQPMHPADVLVLRVSLAVSLVLAVIFICEWWFA